jgi:hypothetical protein
MLSTQASTADLFVNGWSHHGPLDDINVAEDSTVKLIQTFAPRLVHLEMPGAAPRAFKEHSEHILGVRGARESEEAKVDLHTPVRLC